MIEQYSWPGNVRELRNVIERATILAPGPFIEPKHLPASLSGETSKAPQPQVALGPGTTVAERAAADHDDARAHARQQDARGRILGISLKTLHNKLNQLRLSSAKSDQDRFGVPGSRAWLAI